MKIMVLGGDGYLGWPTAMRLSNNGHDVLVVDNYLRRTLLSDTGVRFLQNVPFLEERVKKWNQVGKGGMQCSIGDLREWDFVENIFKEFVPDAVVHFAEQPSAPFSMMSHEFGYLTLENNLRTTFNIIHAVNLFAKEAHIVKLGTMGEYGTPDIDIEEGWLEIEHNGRRDTFLYPRQASSLYHTTKIMDTDLLWFYCRVWGIRVTDLMQGPVYGIFTAEGEASGLYTSFTYDEVFGTVLNRFVTQAVLGIPLTVYGSGGQTRGYLNIEDTLQCISLALNNPAPQGQMRIYNQFTETFSVNELAEKVRAVGEAMGLEPRVQTIKNPRKEKEDHYYNPKHSKLADLGLQPTPLTDDVLVKLIEFVQKNKNNIDETKIYEGQYW